MGLQSITHLLEELNSIYKIDGLAPINPEISSKDVMFVEERHYFNVGFSGLRCILQALFSAQRSRDEIETILDFPSGFGRVLRFIKAYFTKAQITAGEIDGDALTFCADQFKVNLLSSHEDFSKIEITQKFDLIWSGSLITHLNEAKIKEVLKFFFNSLSDKGLLIFSSHGRYAETLLKGEVTPYGLSASQRRDLMEQYEATGFGYVNYNEIAEYGISLAKPSWIVKLLESDYELRIISYAEKCWDNHQDVIACLKEHIS
jgi:SAM-dependent methyltransferase